jgi:hypothetical protein
VVGGGLTCGFWVVFEGGLEDLFCLEQAEGALAWVLRGRREALRGPLGYGEGAKEGN